MIRFLTLVSCQAFLALSHAGEQPAIKEEKVKTAQSSPMQPTVQLQVPMGNSAATKEPAAIYRTANVAFREAKGGDTARVSIETAAKIVAHARKYPTDESSLDGLVNAIGLSSQSPEGAKTRDEAIEVLKTNFAKSPAIRSHFRFLASSRLNEVSCMPFLRAPYRTIFSTNHFVLKF